MIVKTKGDRIFDALNLLVMLSIVVITLGPFWYCLVGSLNDGFDFLRGGILLWPRVFTTMNYRAVFADSAIFQAYKITVARTVLGTVSSVLFTAMVAYGLSKKYLIGRKFYNAIMLFTMFFGGGLIPYYLTLKVLGLIDNFLVYIIPCLFSVWNMIIFQTSFREIPQSLFESAKIDGAGEYRIFFQIVIPLSKPILAAIALFVGVGHWNSYYDSMVFTTSNSLQTIQVFLMKVITNVSEATGLGQRAAAAVPEGARKLTPETIKLATMMATTIPIIIIYPFLQKYFVKGVMIGSIKG